MAMSRKHEARALSDDERELVEKSHHPEVQNLSDAELQRLVKILRERRDKAQAEAYRRRREMRGKAAPKGTRPSKMDAGSKAKLEVLAMAIRRLNAEVERRRQLAARIDLVENARHALALTKAKKPARSADFNSRQAHLGMQAVESGKAKSLVRPMERGRLRKAAAVAQAKRDAKPA